MVGTLQRIESTILVIVDTRLFDTRLRKLCISPYMVEYENKNKKTDVIP